MDIKTKSMKRRIEGLINNPVKLYANADAESALLSICCQAEHAEYAYMVALRAGVELDDFSLGWEVHRLVWLALEDLHTKKRPVTLPTLSSAIKRQLGTSSVGLDTDRALAALVERPCDVNEVELYAREVREAGVRRMAQLEGLELAHNIGVMDAASISTRMTSIGERALLDSQTGTDHAGMFDAMKAHLQTQFARAITGKASGLDTPLHELNKVINGGFKAGCIHYWGGAPGAGKTRLVTYLMADAITRHGAIVDWYSVETINTKTLAMIVASAEAQAARGRDVGHTLTVDNIHELTPNQDDLREAGGNRERAVSSMSRRVSEALARARDWSGEILHQMVGPEFTAQHIYAQVRSRMMMREASRDERPYVVVVDYAQGLRSGERGLVGPEEIQRACERLRYLAKNLNIIVHVIYHTNRANPMQAHGSSQIEKDADFAAVLLRDPERPDSVTLQPTKTRDSACVALEMTVDFARVNYGADHE